MDLYLLYLLRPLTVVRSSTIETPVALSIITVFPVEYAHVQNVKLLHAHARKMP